MYILDIDIVKETNSGVKTVSKEIRFKETVSEITLWEWVQFQLALQDAPDWIACMQSMNKEERLDHLGTWDQQNWSDYYVFIAELVSIFTETPLDEVLEIDKGSIISDDISKDNIAGLFGLINKTISSFKPKEIQKFKYKGKCFVVPKKVIDKLGTVHHAPNISTIEAIEALQVEHVYNVSDSEGIEDEKIRDVIRNRKYHSDLGVIASICRLKKKNKRIERIPLKMIARRKFIDSRVKFFEDLPMDIALSISFFLTSSKKNYVNILTRVMYLKATHEMQKKRQTLLRGKRSGKYLAGIIPSDK